MAVCDKCGREVPQEDIDAGVAFFDGKNTYCHACGELLMERYGILLRRINLIRKGEKARCPHCAEEIPVRFFERYS